MNSKKYCCIFISLKNKLYYFDIILEKHDLSKILNKTNNDLNINFKIKNYFVHKKYGILFLDNMKIKKSNKLFICHYNNLLKFKNSNINLDKSKKLLEMYNNILLLNSINEK